MRKGILLYAGALLLLLLNLVLLVGAAGGPVHPHFPSAYVFEDTVCENVALTPQGVNTRLVKTCRIYLPFELDIDGELLEVEEAIVTIWHTGPLRLTMKINGVEWGTVEHLRTGGPWNVRCDLNNMSDLIYDGFNEIYFGGATSCDTYINYAQICVEYTYRKTVTTVP